MGAFFFLPIFDFQYLISLPPRMVFPNYTITSRPVCKNSVLAKIKAKRAAAKQAVLTSANTNIQTETA